MTMKKLPYEERPREKMILQGREFLSNGELLAILLRTGTKDKSALDLASEVLRLDSTGILFLQNCTLEQLSAIKGLGQAKACQLLAAAELGKRMATMPRKDRDRVTSPADIAALFMEKLRYHNEEHFYVLMINAKGEIIEQAETSIGDLCSTVIHPREVFSKAIKRSAASVVFIHNHPSGDPTPSQQDIDTTQRLVQAADILGINVLDHIVIGDGEYISLKSCGHM